MLDDIKWQHANDDSKQIQHDISELSKWQYANDDIKQTTDYITCHWWQQANHRLYHLSLMTASKPQIISPGDDTPMHADYYCFYITCHLPVFILFLYHLCTTDCYHLSFPYVRTCILVQHLRPILKICRGALIWKQLVKYHF